MIADTMGDNLDANTTPGDLQPPHTDVGARLVKCPCFDFELYVDPADRTAWPIVNLGVYEHHIMPVFRETVKPGMTVLDIGANIGVYTVAAGLLGAEVIAVDASTQNCKLVAVNARLNGLNPTILPVAVSDGLGMELFRKTEESNKVIRNYDFGLSSFDQFEATFAMPVDAIIGSRKIDVVKIDIEGREYNALSTARKLFEHRPSFFLEYSPRMSEAGSGVKGEGLLKLFTERGYSMMVIGLRGPNVHVGQDIDEVNRIWATENDAGIVITDLLLTP